MLQSKIFILNPKNAIHQFLLEELQQNHVVVRLEGTVKSLQKYRFSSLQAQPTLLIIQQLKPSRELKRLLAQIRLRNRKLCFFVKHKNDIEFLKDCGFAEEILILPTYEKWKDREQMFLQTLQSRGIQFISSKVMIETIRLLMRKQDGISQLLTEMALINEREPIEQRHLHDLFQSVEIISLQDWALGMLQGKRFTKSISELNYFLSVKKYSVHWMGEYVKKEVLQLGMLYEAFHKGIFYNKATLASIQSRATAVDFPQAKQLKRVKLHHLRNYADYVEATPFTMFLQIQAVVLSSPLHTEEEILQVVCQIRGLIEGG